MSELMYMFYSFTHRIKYMRCALYEPCCGFNLALTLWYFDELWSLKRIQKSNI